MPFGGDLYHAVGKLKQAYEIWISRIFVVAAEKERSRVGDLLGGAFHEVRNELKFVSVDVFGELLNRKKEVRRLEAELGLL
ncbi:MAG: hypothetical protein O2854_02555 [Chloroflexi bacterium]|nr:hypothetical protein [Chloroflexota bacterium]